MDEISDAIQKALAAKVGRIYSSFSNVQEVTSDEEAIVKGEETDEENPFEKAAEKDDNEEEEIEKSDIMDVLSDSNSSIKISKTGKEIKEQVNNVLLPAKISDLVLKEEEANKKLKECGIPPTKEPDRWFTNGIKIDCAYKIYDWQETYFPNKSEEKIMSSLSAEDLENKKGNLPENQEQATCRAEYNNLVGAICNIKIDIKACEILKTLEDEKQFEISPYQVLTLRF